MDVIWSTFKSHRLVSVAVATGALALTLSIATWLYVPARTSFLRGIAHVFVPQELSSATFVADGSVGSALFPGLEKTERLPGWLVSETHDAHGSVRIVESMNKDFSVVVDGIVLFTSTTPHLSIVRSPNGKRIAYAEAIRAEDYVSPAQAPGLSSDRKSWKVSVYEPATRSTFMLGIGAAPLFIDDTHLAWMAPAGLSVADLSTGSIRLLVPETQGRIPSIHLVSPDHTLMALNTGGKNSLTIYRVTAEGAKALPETIIPRPYTSVALGNDGVYVVRSRGGMAEVAKVPFGGSSPMSVMPLPLGLHITRLNTGSL